MYKTKVNQNETNVSPKDSIQMINDGTYEFGDPTVMWLRMPPDSWVTVTKGGRQKQGFCSYVSSICDEELRFT